MRADVMRRILELIDEGVKELTEVTVNNNDMAIEGNLFDKDGGGSFMATFEMKENENA